MKYLKVTDSLFLVEQPVPATPDTTSKMVSENVNHIWIYDRSYSMSYELPQLADDIIERAKQIPEGDTVTLGWFSSEGQHNFILKGFKIGSDSDWKVLERAVSENKRPIGTTCFSEILDSTETVVKDLSVFSDAFALCFFTDGYPVVRNYEKEITNITKAIDKVGDRIAASLMVGYGDYYNKELMANMAESLGGSLAHCSRLHEFGVSLDTFVKQAQDLAPKIEVKLETDTKKDDLVFTVREGTVAVHTVESNNTVKVSPKRRGDLSVFILSSSVPTNATEVVLTEDVISRTSKKESLVQGAYAASFLLTQKTNVDLALNVLGSLGDKSLIDSVNNSFTNADYGKAENKIKSAVFSPKDGRLKQGYDPKYLPKEDAFCLVDVLNLLMKDPTASFFPYHEDFKYKRVGKKSVAKDGYPTFSAEKDVKCPLNSLTWNSTKLNLSVLARINGTVELPKGYDKLGFSKDYPTFVWRNYTVVKDGFLNTQHLPVTLSKDSYETLSKEGVIWSNTEWEENRIYILELDKVPVMNRAIANGRTSATELCKKAYEEVKLKGVMKALNSLKKELDDSETTGTVFTEEQQEFLTTSGFRKDGSFSPPVEKSEPVDSYNAKEFAIKIKGHSSLPSLKDVRKKIEAGKSQTVTGELVKAGLDLFDQKVDSSATKQLQLATVNDLITKTKADLFAVRDYIQTTKFAVILGKKWFDEFESRDDSSLEVNGVNFDLSLKEISVDI